LRSEELVEWLRGGNFDLYAKYFWTHQSGEDLVVGPDPVHFEDVNSHRIRAGARLSHEISDEVKFYVGAAYEGETDGKAKASAYGLAFDVPELKGSSGVGELGLSLKAGDRVNVDVGVQGYAGDRRGVSGSVRLNYQF
jgi:hypothetical protein